MSQTLLEFANEKKANFVKFLRSNLPENARENPDVIANISMLENAPSVIFMQSLDEKFKTMNEDDLLNEMIGFFGLTRDKLDPDALAKVIRYLALFRRVIIEMKNKSE
jgi:hypothetical protein